jgi:hypothetical protein
MISHDWGLKQILDVSNRFGRHIACPEAKGRQILDSANHIRVAASSVEAKKSLGVANADFGPD